jgi:hypothetical protein
MKEHHAVDLDGTLAQHDDSAEYDPAKIGAPVPKMLERVKGWLDKGDDVSIFTARVHEPGAYPHIKKWLREQGLPDLEVTNKKQPKFTRFHDDKATGYTKNTGEPKSGEDESATWEDEARKEMA